MTILNGNVKTHYDFKTKLLSRVTLKGMQTMDTKKMREFSVADLQRLTNIDDESFELMSEVQNELRQ